MQAEIDSVAELLRKNGIKNAHKKLNFARDFQNFNDEHCNIVTLSKVTNDDGKEHYCSQNGGSCLKAWQKNKKKNTKI